MQNIWLDELVEDDSMCLYFSQLVLYYFSYTILLLNQRDQKKVVEHHAQNKMLRNSFYQSFSQLLNELTSQNFHINCLWVFDEVNKLALNNQTTKKN